METVVREYSTGCLVFLSKELVTGPTIFSGGEEVISVNPQGYWCGFIDRQPGSAWGHDCTCVAVDNKGVIKIDQYLPPEDDQSNFEYITSRF